MPVFSYTEFRQRPDFRTGETYQHWQMRQRRRAARAARRGRRRNAP